MSEHMRGFPFKLMALKGACLEPTYLVYKGDLGNANWGRQQAATGIRVTLVEKENDAEELDNPSEDGN